MFGAQHFPTLIRELQVELEERRGGARSTAQPVERPSDPRWRARAHELALRRIKSPQEFLDWAKRDRHWSFTLAEVLREAHADPAELAARLAVAMLEQLADERETLEANEAELPAGIVAAYAD
jgi:hypothetical protein